MRRSSRWMTHRSHALSSIPPLTSYVGQNVSVCNLLMSPPHLTLAKPKSWFLKHNLHTIDIISTEPSWQ